MLSTKNWKFLFGKKKSHIRLKHKWKTEENINNNNTRQRVNSHNIKKNLYKSRKIKSPIEKKSGKSDEQVIKM